MKTKIIEKRKKFFDKKFLDTVNDPRKFWHNINSLLYNKNSKKKESFELKDTGGHLLSDGDTASSFNDHFIEIPEKLIEGEYGKLNDSNSVLTSSFSSTHSMFLQAVDEEEIFNTIMNLKNSSSTGVDNLNTNIFKQCAENLAQILPTFINHSFVTGNFPVYLKVARVIPIYKGSGSKTDINNYRPISLLNVISKIYEACIYRRLYSFLNFTKFFEKNNQFGFLRDSNTSSACISFIDKVQRALNKNKLVATLFLDVTKAFDCVVRSLLLKKLQQIGIRGNGSIQ